MKKTDFFNELSKDTAPPVKEVPELPAADKETYTRAEVDELISKKIAETLESMKEPEPPADPEPPAEKTEE